MRMDVSVQRTRNPEEPNFEDYRIRTLLYAAKPNWRVLGSVVVR